LPREEGESFILPERKCGNDFCAGKKKQSGRERKREMENKVKATMKPR